MRKVLLVLILATVLSAGMSAMAQNKVVVIPLNSSGVTATDRVWGQGRLGTGLLAHTPASEYCTSPTGIKFALSLNLVSWGSSSSVCPSQTWVCRQEDLPTTGSCPVNPVDTYSQVLCDGTLLPTTPSTQTALTGWIADASATFWGRSKYSADFTKYYSNNMCKSMRVWCCWE